MGITIFKIFIWGGILSNIRSKNRVLRLRLRVVVKLNFQPYIRPYISPNENFEYSYPLSGLSILLHGVFYSQTLRHIIRQLLSALNKFWMRNKKINFILSTLIDLEVRWLICDYLPSSSWARRMFPGFISLCRNPCSLRCFIPNTGKKMHQTMRCQPGTNTLVQINTIFEHN